MSSWSEELENRDNFSAARGPQWYAIRVRTRTEKMVATLAGNKGFETFLPVYETRRKWSDRYQSVELPLFPGYVFSRLNIDHRFPLLTIPSVLHFVGIGKTPVAVDPEEISAIQTAVGSGLLTEPWPFIEAGD